MKREGAVDTKDMTVELNKDEFEKFLRIGYGVDRAMWIVNDRCKDGIMNFIKTKKNFIETKRNGAKERRPSGGLTSRRSGMDHSADAVGHEANVTCHARKTIGHLSGRLTGH